jgi:hypothetical protein
MVLQSLCTCAGTITYFIPTLMGALGYKGNMVQYVRRLLFFKTCITDFCPDDDPYMCASSHSALTILTSPSDCASLVIVLICCFSSDLQNERPKHIMVMASISTISLIIVAAVNTNNRVRYAFLTFGALRHLSSWAPLMSSV